MEDKKSDKTTESIDSHRTTSPIQFFTDDSQSSNTMSHDDSSETVNRPPVIERLYAACNPSKSQEFLLRYPKLKMFIFQKLFLKNGIIATNVTTSTLAHGSYNFWYEQIFLLKSIDKFCSNNLNITI